MIRLLDKYEHHQLDPFFNQSWNAYAPIEHASILVEEDEGELIAFASLEDVVLIGGIQVVERHRGERGQVAITRLIKRLKKSAAESGRTFIMGRHDTRSGHLAHAFGFRKCADEMYRTDRFRKD